MYNKYKLLTRVTMNKYSITSNEAKLFKHLDHLKKIQNKHAAPVMVVVSPTNRCNLHCVHCCFNDRNKQIELNFDFLKESLLQFKKVGIKSVELAGGGEPTLYPQLEELIEYVTGELNLKMGMNTNSISLNARNLNKLEWVRLSLNFFDNSNLNWNKIEEKILHIKEQGVTLSACYIIPQIKYQHNIEKVIEFSERNKIPTRIAPDCCQEKTKISELIDQSKNIVGNSEYCFISDFNLYLQKRPDNFCLMPYIKPLLYTDGNVYACPSFELSIENKRDVEKKFKICSGDAVYEYYSNNFEIFNFQCEYCKYARQNEILYYVTLETEFKDFT